MFFVFQTVSAQAPPRPAGGLLANAARRGAQEGTLNQTQAERVIQQAQVAQREVRMPVRDQTRNQPLQQFQNPVHSLRPESNQRMEQNEFASKSPCGAGGCGGCNGCRSFSKEDVQNYIEFSNERPQLSMEGGLKVEPKVEHQSPFRVQNFAINPNILKRFHEEEDRRKELRRGRSGSLTLAIAAKTLEEAPPVKAEAGKNMVVPAEALAGGDVKFTGFSKQPLSIRKSAPELIIPIGTSRVAHANNVSQITGLVLQKEEKTLSVDTAIHSKYNVLMRAASGMLVSKSKHISTRFSSSAAKTSSIKQAKKPVIRTLYTSRPPRITKTSKSIANARRTRMKTIKDARSEKRRSQNPANAKAKRKKTERANESKRHTTTNKTGAKKLEKENTPAQVKGLEKRRGASNPSAKTSKQRKNQPLRAKTNAKKPVLRPKNNGKSKQGLHSKKRVAERQTRERKSVQKSGKRAISKTKTAAVKTNTGGKHGRNRNVQKQISTTRKRLAFSAGSPKMNRSRKGGPGRSVGTGKRDLDSASFVPRRAA